MAYLSVKANIDVDEQRHETVKPSVAEATVGSASEQLLRQSSRLVNKYIQRLDKRKRKREEDIHQLRVATRRTMAVLRLCSELLPENRARRFYKKLKKVLRITGEARDLDVLKKQKATGFLGDYPAFWERLYKRQKRTQKRMLRHVRKLSTNGRFEKKSRKLLRSLKDADCPKNSVHAWIQRNVRRIATNFEDSAPSAIDSVAQLHHFRLQVKKTRYEIEQLSQLDPSVGGGAWRELIEDLQERLGNINDLAYCHSQTKEWTHTLSHRLSKEKLEQLLTSAHGRLQAAVSEFAQWWTPKQHLLRKHLRAMDASDDSGINPS